MTILPTKYTWLLKEPGPRLLVEGLKTFGTVETPGPNDNPAIMAWAKATGMAKIYAHDSTAWCGLWMAYVALQAGWDVPTNPLWARNWSTWGKQTTNPLQPMLGDVLTFARGSSGHVGIYVGDDIECFHVLGGNQSDRVMIKRIARNRLITSRRCPWRINQPGNVRRVILAATGAISTNEA